MIMGVTSYRENWEVEDLRQGHLTWGPLTSTNLFLIHTHGLYQLPDV
jgi:hypothetical protein